ncbi:MAG: AEC family transporter [Anaerolineae bacterium]|nr:AEC family transporter [Anaerolineae bacterium]
MSTLEITYNIISPIFIIVGLVVVFDRIFEVDPRGLSRLVVYLFTPFLVFDGLANMELQAGEAQQLAVISICMSLLIALTAWIIAKWRRYDQRLESALILTATLINAGNYGIPLNKLAFGEAGEARALIFFTGSVMVTYTVGVFVASRGAVSTRDALLNVFKVPMPYAAALGLFVNQAHIDLPGPISHASEIAAGAAIPGMLAVLGLRLSRASLGKYRRQLGPILIGAGLRLVIAPLIAVGLVTLLGVSGVTRQVAIVQSAMPTAVIAGVLATEFGSDAEFVIAATLVDTLVSMVTLSILLTWVM